MTRLLHRFPRKRLYAAVAVVATLALGVGIAQAALGGSNGPKPPPRPLAQAVLSALQAPKLDGISADVHITNKLLPAGTLPKGTSEAFASDADGHVWLDVASHRIHAQLQTAAGQVEIAAGDERVSLYDQASNTLYTLPNPTGTAHGDRSGGGLQLGGGGIPLAAMQQALGALLKSWDISGAKPTSTAGRPTYTVRISPKDDGGLLGAAEVAWDAERGVPLRAAVYAQGNADPVFEIAATKVAYGPIAAADLQPADHPHARVVAVDPSTLAAHAVSEGVSGAKAVAHHLPFKLAAPDQLAGLDRTHVELLSFDGRPGAVSIYGRGLGTVAVLQYQAKDSPSDLRRHALNLPQVNIDGITGRELATALGTAVTFERDGVSYVVAGLVPPVAAENAARGLH